MLSSSPVAPSAPASTALPEQKRMPRRSARPHMRARAWVLFVTPALVLYLLFVISPILSSFYYSLTNWNALDTAPAFVGTANFQALLHDPQFWSSMRITAIYAVVTVLLQNGIALVLALCLDAVGNRRGVGALRTFFLIPGLISGLAISYVWEYMYNPNGGLVNSLLGTLHLGQGNHDWLGDPHTALGSIIVAALWQSIAFSMVVYVAGIQAVPQELLESARVDGASYLRRVTQVVLPLIAPAFTINLVFGLIGSLKVFDVIYIMTSGGPAYATQTILIEVYQQAFTLFDFGYASAIGLLAFLMILVVSIGALVLLRRREVVA